MTCPPAQTSAYCPGELVPIPLCSHVLTERVQSRQELSAATTPPTPPCAPRTAPPLACLAPALHASVDCSLLDTFLIVFCFIAHSIAIFIAIPSATNSMCNDTEHTIASTHAMADISFFLNRHHRPDAETRRPMPACLTMPDLATGPWAVSCTARVARKGVVRWHRRQHPVQRHRQKEKEVEGRFSTQDWWLK